VDVFAEGKGSCLWQQQQQQQKKTFSITAANANSCHIKLMIDYKEGGGEWEKSFESALISFSFLYLSHSLPLHERKVLSRKLLKRARKLIKTFLFFSLSKNTNRRYFQLEVE
jgi:hypothetical protein